MEIDQYLDNEFEGIDISLGQEELFRKFDPNAFEIFEKLVENIYRLWDYNYASVEDIMDAEFKANDYIYRNPELSKICLAIHRDKEETTLEYVVDNLSQPKSLLDLGCGAGNKSIYYAIATGAEITAVDIVQSGLDLIKENAMKYGLNNISTIKADIRDFDLGRGFDGVFANCVLHESGDNGRGIGLSNKIRNVTKHLNPGGMFIATLDQIHESGEMAYGVAEHAEKQGLHDVNVELILRNEYSNLMAIKATK